MGCAIIRMGNDTCGGSRMHKPRSVYWGHGQALRAFRHARRFLFRTCWSISGQTPRKQEHAAHEPQ